MMINWYQNNRYVLSSSGNYSMSSSYIALLGNLHRFYGAELVWSSILLPKHRVIFWLVYQNRLLTKDRLVRMHLEVENDKCCLCSEEEKETHQHLFAECFWFNEVLGWLSGWWLSGWLGISLPRLYTRNCLDWLRRRQWRQGKKDVVAAVWGATIYHTWKVRNWKIFRNTEVNTRYVAAQIKKEIKIRLEGIETTRKARRSKNWLQTIVNRW